jgi:hypothetical protein
MYVCKITYKHHTRFISVGIAEASQTFLRDAHVIPELLSYEECTHQPALGPRGWLWLFLLIHPIRKACAPAVGTFNRLMMMMMMRNTADVTGGNSIKSISGVSAVNPLEALYNFHGRKRQVLFICSGYHTRLLIKLN